MYNFSLLKFCDNFVNLCSEDVLPRDDFGELGVELIDIHLFAGVFLLDVGGNRQIIVSGGDVGVGDEAADVVLVSPAGKCGEDVADVGGCELVGVRDLHALFRGVDEQGAVVLLRFLQDHNAGCDRGAEEKVVRELDHRVHEIVVNQVLPYLLLSAAAVHHAREADYRRGAVGGEPREGVHYEGQVGLGLRSQNAGRGETGVVDEGDVELVVVDVVEGHIDAARARFLICCRSF